MSTAEGGAIEFRLLGPVEAIRDGTPLPLGGRRQRALLALLLLQSGRAVSADRLAEELWHGRPPPGAAATLRAYVSKLRTALGDEAPISSSAAGYALEVPSEWVDARRFERLADEGREAWARGAARRAAERLRAALDLWQGRPFAGLEEESALQLEAQRLEELRLLALEDRIEADLTLGAAEDLVDELEMLAREHPYRERLWRQLMLALYRAERQADALAAYREARRMLDEELGLEPSEELKDLEVAILRHEVPPARPPEERHNLPTPPTSFVGRESELAEVERLLGAARLLTLTGVGGAGKTRLAVEAAHRARLGFPDGAFFVDLAPLADPELAAQQVAAALEVREHPEKPLDRQLADVFRDGELLLVLDNCEHVREPVAELVHGLLTGCPRLRVLATSREPLGVPGEVDYPVPPLSLPPADADAEELRASEAVLLLLARSRESRPALGDDARILASAGRICRDLDGLPLAIELAAARVKALSLDEIAARLADRFRFLVSWRRLAAARHRTLREAMDWSYELLPDAERELLSRLSVFAGGFDVATAAAVCLDGDESAAVDLIGHLVETSLVIAEEEAGQTRYRLLETVRQYAAERLEEQNETADARHRHTAYFVEHADRLRPLSAESFGRFIEQVGRDADNFRSALTAVRDACDTRSLHRVGNALWRYWWVRGELREGLGWLRSALESGSDVEASVRATVLEGAAGLSWAIGDFASAREYADAALPTFELLGDPRGRSAILIVLGHVAYGEKDWPLAEDLYERARRAGEEVGPPLDPRAFVAVALHNLASTALCQGQVDRAVMRYEEALALYRESDDRYGIALCEVFLAFAALDGGDDTQAVTYLRRALPVFRAMGFRQYSIHCVEGTAVVAQRRGDHELAVRLLSAAGGLRERIGRTHQHVELERCERVLDLARSELDADTFESAREEGRALSEEQMLDRAQALLDA